MNIISFGVIIQARMGSKRLPGKVLKKLDDKTILDYILYFIKKDFPELKKKTVVATSKLKRDLKIISWCKKNKIKYFFGDEKNVLKRYYNCSKSYKFTNIIRLTADNPFPDFKNLKKLIILQKKYKYDYISNQKTLPKGMGLEIISSKAIEKSILESYKPNHFEHVNEYILENKKKFSVKILKKKYISKNLNFSIDKKKDLKFCKKVLSKIKKPITIKKIIKYASI